MVSNDIVKEDYGRYKALCYVGSHWSRPLDIACRFRSLASSRAKEQSSLVQLIIISTDTAFYGSRRRLKYAAPRSTSFDLPPPEAMHFTDTALRPFGR